MGPLHIASAPPPALSVAGDRAPVANAYFAVTVDAAVDLREARGYRSLTRAERVSRAQAEQREFVGGFLDPGLGAALDLRVAVDPAAAAPLSVALLGRVWGGSADAVAKRAEELRGRVLAAVPQHVTAVPVDDGEVVERLLKPFPGIPVDSAVITRHELIGVPSRPDAGVSYYYSAAPFTWSDDDWSTVYAALAASPVPLVLSVALLPLLVPPSFAQTLRTLAGFYGRLAREGEAPAGFYHSRQRLAPDPFTVGAGKDFHEFAHRLGHKAFALRIQVSAPRQLPPGIVETIAAAVSPALRGAGPAGLQEPPFAGDVRRPASVAERRLAEYNLNAINFGLLAGRPEIWGRPDPPDPQLAMLTVLGDARDACCAFRLPIAADGVLPWFRVHRGQPTAADAEQAAGPVIRIGKVCATDRDIVLPLRWLSGHMLIAGSPGSGKTTTAAEIVRQLWADHQVPFLVIAPTQSAAADYRRLAGAPGFESLEVLTAGDEGATPLRFNPFEVPDGMLIGAHAANLLTCFTAALGLPGPVTLAYRDALSLTYLRAGFLLSERATGPDRAWPTIADFGAALDEVSDDLGHPDAGRARGGGGPAGRVRPLAAGTAGSVLLTSRPAGLGRLLGHPVILDLSALVDGAERALLTALVLNAVAGHHQAAEPATGLTHVTVAEEASRLFAGPGLGPRSGSRAAAALARRLTGSRGNGSGMILTERSPAELARDAVRNPGLKVIHRLTAEDDRRCLAEAAGLDQPQQALAARLRDGEALLYSDELAEAVHAGITATLPPGPPPAVTRSATPPFAACERCRAQCEHRGAALSILQDRRTAAAIAAAAAAPPAGRLADAPPETGPDADGGRRAELRRVLYEAVGRFPALPAADPGRGDAAYCLFLHVQATTRPRPDPGWPAVVAGLLGIDPAGSGGPVRSAEGKGAALHETDGQ